MPWATPETWTHLELNTAAKANSDLRDNMVWLKTRPWATDTSATPSTASTTPVVISGLSVPLTVTGGACLFLFQTSVSVAVGASVAVNFQYRVDGVQIGSTITLYTQGAGLVSAVSLWHITSTPPTAGARTFEMYWYTGSSTLSASSNTTQLWIVELF
jgi:hypothetical protein